jgi:hypothetical protein
MAYSGRYSLKNPGKYTGDGSRVMFRSLWERQTFRFLDESPDIVAWSSEEIVIPYICKTDNRPHRYFVDLHIQFRDGRQFLIEIKPKCQTVPPKEPSRQTRRYITEVLAYVKNQSKWDAADAYAKSRGWTFNVWTEETLRSLGIRLLT